MVPTTKQESARRLLVDTSFRINPGFEVTGGHVRAAIERTNESLSGLPMALYRTIDLKAQSGVVGAYFASHLADVTGAIVNPVEKGHPDIVPASAAKCSEPDLRRYIEGVEVKATIGNVNSSRNLGRGVARVADLTSITWQAHHQEVRELMALTWDYVGGTSAKPRPPAITAVYFTDDLNTADWGDPSGLTGRGTKVTGLRASGRAKVAAGLVAIVDDHQYQSTLARKVGPAGAWTNPTAASAA